MTVFLAYLAKPKYGGWPTYTSHLLRGMRAAGHDTHIVKHGNKTEGKTRPFGRKLCYQNVSTADLLTVARTDEVLITAVDKHYHAIAVDLLAAGASIVVHDPTEIKDPIRDILPDANVIVIRDSMLSHLPNATLIPHPYLRRALPPVTTKRRAVSISRVDFDKHTELIVEANRTLDEPIDIYGALNGLYSKITLDEVDPQWKENYRGRFPADDLWAAVRLAHKYEHVVDMSVIKGDGGGSQYTFLEAADSGASLILNEQWSPTDLLADYATTVNSAEQLIEAVTRPPRDTTSSAEAFLRHHDARRIAHQTFETLQRHR